MTDFMEIVNAAILWNCRALSVPVPSIRIVEPAELATPTTRCAVSSDGDELLINRDFAKGGVLMRLLFGLQSPMSAAISGKRFMQSCSTVIRILPSSPFVNTTAKRRRLTCGRGV